MDNYSDEELSSKINRFMARKVEQFPELKRVRKDSKRVGKLNFGTNLSNEVYTVFPMQRKAHS